MRSFLQCENCCAVIPRKTEVDRIVDLEFLSQFLDLIYPPPHLQVRRGYFVLIIPGNNWKARLPSHYLVAGTWLCQ